MADITAPVADFNGAVVGVTFEDGKASIPNDSPLLAYFTRHGYTITDESATEPVRRSRTKK